MAYGQNAPSCDPLTSLNNISEHVGISIGITYKIIFIKFCIENVLL